MKIFITNSKNIKRVKKTLVPISISHRRLPDWENKLTYDKLVPNLLMVAEYLTRDKDIKTFLNRYQNEILGKLNPNNVIEDLEKLSGGQDIILVANEESTKEHRSLLIDWFKEAADVAEYK